MKSCKTKKEEKQKNIKNDLFQFCEELIQKEKGIFFNQAYRKAKKRHPNLTLRFFSRWMEECGLVSQFRAKNRNIISKKTMQEYLETNTLKAATEHFGCSFTFIRSKLHEGEKIEDLISSSDNPEEVKILEKYLESVKTQSRKKFSFPKMAEDIGLKVNKIKKIIYSKHHRRVQYDIKAYQNQSLKRKRDADSCEEIMPHSKRHKPKGSPEYEERDSE